MSTMSALGTGSDEKVRYGSAACDGAQDAMLPDGLDESFGRRSPGLLNTRSRQGQG